MCDGFEKVWQTTHSLTGNAKRLDILLVSSEAEKMR